MADLYAALIFNPPLAEGIQGKLIVDSNLDGLKLAVEQEVSSLNSDEELGDFEWAGLSYYPESNPEYGGFAWGRIHEVIPGQPIDFTD